jgi:diguanylate cyclase (GGDEF) domain
MIIIAVMDLISIFTQWLFYIDADGHFQNSDLFFLQSIVNYSYLVIPTILNLIKASKSKLSHEKAEYLTYSLYMTPPIITSIFEDTLTYVPLLALNILMMVIIMFMKIQNLRISNDALTGLNNRRRLNSFLSEKLSKTSESNPLLIFIIDINDFKSINDQYGHIEGDHALQLFSSALKTVASECFAFAARYGGDEFCLVMNQSGRKCDEIKDKINQTLADLQDKDKKYIVTVSIGCALCTQVDEMPESVLRRADKMLYESKKQWHDRNH